MARTRSRTAAAGGRGRGRGGRGRGRDKRRRKKDSGFGPLGLGEVLDNDGIKQLVTMAGEFAAETRTVTKNQWRAAWDALPASLVAYLEATADGADKLGGMTIANGLAHLEQYAPEWLGLGGGGGGSSGGGAPVDMTLSTVLLDFDTDSATLQGLLRQELASLGDLSTAELQTILADLGISDKDSDAERRAAFATVLKSRMPPAVGAGAGVAGGAAAAAARAGGALGGAGGGPSHDVTCGACGHAGVASGTKGLSKGSKVCDKCCPLFVETFDAYLAGLGTTERDVMVAGLLVSAESIATFKAARVAAAAKIATLGDGSAKLAEYMEMAAMVQNKKDVGVLRFGAVNRKGDPDGTSRPPTKEMRLRRERIASRVVDFHLQRLAKAAAGGCQKTIAKELKGLCTHAAEEAWRLKVASEVGWVAVTNLEEDRRQADLACGVDDAKMALVRAASLKRTKAALEKKAGADATRASSARGGGRGGGRGGRQREGGRGKRKGGNARRSEQRQRAPKKPRGPKAVAGTDGKVFKGIECHACKKYGHYQDKCPGVE